MWMSLQFYYELQDCFWYPPSRHNSSRLPCAKRKLHHKSLIAPVISHFLTKYFYKTNSIPFPSYPQLDMRQWKEIKSGRQLPVSPSKIELHRHRENPVDTCCASNKARSGAVPAGAQFAATAAAAASPYFLLMHVRCRKNVVPPAARS